MLISIKLGQLAAAIYKEAACMQRGRSGRRVKGNNIKKELHAAGSPKHSPGVFSYPRGQKV